MRRFLWLGIFFLSVSWLYFIPQFTVPDIPLGVFFIGLGILCIIAGLWNVSLKHLDIRYTILLIPLLGMLFLVPFPYTLGLMVLTLGLLISIPFYKRKALQIIPFGIMISGIILIVQTVVFPLYVIFVSHGHRVDALSPIISFVANLVGQRTSTMNGMIFVQTVQGTYPVTITWEKLGLVPWLNIFLGAIVIFILLYKRQKILSSTIIILLTSILYIILRFLAVLVGYLITMDLSIFWDPLSLMLSFLPLTLLFIKVLPLRDVQWDHLHVPPVRITKKHLLTFLLVYLAFFSFIGACIFQDPGELKTGRVLIDEYHSQWEDTIRPLDTEWYGLLSTYNYYSWAQWLGYYFNVMININASLTEDMLSKYDILILKCPTESYSSPEVQAITAFVANGGGLYLIGDHTNVFGMNTFLNQVSEEFGIRYKTDATYELGTGDLSVYYQDHLWAHPVMLHVPQFEFMTSCTLEPTSLLASIRMENLIIGNRVTSEPGTYATENFFRESIDSPDSEYGYLLQAAAIKYGHGRVVAFTDSTVFSSFSMFTDGYPPFTLGTLTYLNKTNSFVDIPLILLCIAILSWLLLFVLLRKENKFKVFWVFLVAGFLAFLTIMPFSAYLNAVSYQLPLANSDFTTVCFDQQHCSCIVSVKPTATFGDNKNNYGTFYVWTQRVGCVPSVQATLADAIAYGDIVVFINPTQPFTESDIQQITAYLETGGRVLLMGSIMNTNSTANELTSTFGIWCSVNIHDQALHSNGTEGLDNATIGNITAPYLTIVGGNPILNNLGNETYASMTEVLNKTTGTIGKLVVVVDSYTFSDVLMGGVFIEPTEQQRHLYATEFFLLETVLKPEISS
jgi:hypothetical protein